MTTQSDIQQLTDAQPSQNTPVLRDTSASEPTQVAPPKQHRRWGRIPRLPAKVRLSLNQSLRDGATYDQILQQLAASGHAHVTYDNVATWAKTGYIDWLRDQEHFEKLVITMDRDRTTKPARTNRKNFRDLSDLDIAVLLNNAAREFNLEKLRDQIEAKQDSFWRLVHANAMHERNAILRDRNEIELKKVAAKKQKRATKPKKAGVTKDEFDAINHRLNIM